MPKVSTRQSHMETFLGKMPAVDSNHYIDDMAFKVNVVAKTADYTVLATESGTFFTNYGATALITYTLPTMADGLNYHFYSVSATGITVASANADEICAHNDVDAADVTFSETGSIIGGCFHVVCDGTQWYVIPYLNEGHIVLIS